MHKEFPKRKVEELLLMASISVNVLMDLKMKRLQVKSPSATFEPMRLCMKVKCSTLKNMGLVSNMMSEGIFFIKVNLGLIRGRVGVKLKNIWGNLRMICTMDGANLPLIKLFIKVISHKVNIMESVSTFTPKKASIEWELSTDPRY